MALKNSKKKTRSTGTDIPLHNIPERSRTHKSYTDDFKRNAVKMLKAGDKSAEQIAAELGVPSGSMVSKWARRVEAGLPITARGAGPAAGVNIGSEIAGQLKQALAKATKARDDRLEAAAMIVEHDVGGHDGGQLAKSIRKQKRET